MTPPEAFTFPSGADQLVGLLHGAAAPSAKALMILVGGPQYRVGAHRQYVHLARHVAASGIHAMRFDYAGVGDSPGRYPGFKRVEADIAAAIDALIARRPEVEQVYLWGLCEGASSALLGIHRHPRVAGLVLVNPWVHSQEGQARAYIKHYYAGRLFSAGFWRRLLSGEVNILGSVRDFLRKAGQARRRSDGIAEPDAGADRPYQDRMAEGLAEFQGRVLLLLSGRDLVAREFEDLARASPLWRRAMAGADITRHPIEPADHTFSTEAWRTEAARATADWLADRPIGSKG